MTRLAKVVAGLLVVCVLALPGGALVQPAATNANPVVSVAESVAQFALLKLGNYLANQPNTLGSFLKVMGLGDPSTRELDGIQKTVDEINTKVEELKKSVDQLKGRVEKVNCNLSQAHLRESQAVIEEAWRTFSDTVRLAKTADKQQKMKLGAELPAKIDREFRGATPAATVTLIHNTLVGTPPLSSMISDCGVAYQEAAAPFVSSLLRKQVESLVQYWQGLEAEAAVMNIGLLVKAGEESRARDAFDRAKSNLVEEKGKIKPSLDNLVLDTRTHLVWRKHFEVTTYDKRNVALDLKYGRLPSYSEVEGLFRGCCASMKAIDWLRHDTPFLVPNPQPEPLGFKRALVSRDYYKNAEGKLELSLGATDLNADKPKYTKVGFAEYAYWDTVVNTNWGQFLYTS